MTLELFVNNQRFETSFKDSESEKIRKRIQDAVKNGTDLQIQTRTGSIILNPGAVQNLVTVWS